MRALSAYGRTYRVTDVGSREATEASTDTAAVKAAIATAQAEKQKAVAKHKAEGKTKGEVWASGGGRLFKQGAGEAPESGETLTEKTPWVAAEMAKFSELGPHHDVGARRMPNDDGEANLPAARPL